jgi:hypothetical protein
MGFYMVSKQALWTMMDLSLPVEHVFDQKLSHVRGCVKVSYIAKRYMIWTLYKPLTHLLSQGIF